MLPCYATGLNTALYAKRPKRNRLGRFAYSTVLQGVLWHGEVSNYYRKFWNTVQLVFTSADVCNAEGRFANRSNPVHVLIFQILVREPEADSAGGTRLMYYKVRKNQKATNRPYSGLWPVIIGKSVNPKCQTREYSKMLEMCAVWRDFFVLEKKAFVDNFCKLLITFFFFIRKT